MPSKLENEIDQMINHEQIAKKTSLAWMSKLKISPLRSSTGTSGGDVNKHLVKDISVVDTFTVNLVTTTEFIYS